MFGFTPKTRQHDRLDNSEMISSLGSSVDNDQLNIDLINFGAYDSTDLSQNTKVINESNLDTSNSSENHVSEHSVETSKYFDIDSLDDDFYDDEYLKEFAAQESDKPVDLSNMETVLGDIAPILDDAQGSYEEIDDTDILKSSDHNTTVEDELSNQVEQVCHDDNPPKVIILDEDDALREVNSQKRVSAQVNDILNLSEEKKSKAKFALIGQNLYNVQKDEDNLLSNEKKEFGKIEAEDFITGNVTVVSQTLRTGTDNVVIATSAESQAVEEPQESNQDSLHEVDFEGEPSRCSITLSLPNDNQEDKDPPLFPSLLRDFGVHWFTYGLAILVCVLCLLKVYQVQETRDLTARLNEVVATNADLEKQWLILVASRQKLSEHTNIRSSASEILGMVSPKTENEKVIYLGKK